MPRDDLAVHDKVSRRSRIKLCLALGAIAAVWTASLARWLSTDSVVPWDSKNQFYAFFRFLAQSINSGTSPFWNPYHYGGHPSIADPQSLVFSLPFLAWGFFDSAPSLRAFDTLIYMHLLVGGLAIAGFGWRRHWPPAATMLASAVFMLGGAASARLQHSGIIISYGLFPVALLTLEIAMERRSIAWGALFILTATQMAIGRNQVALLLCFLLFVWALRIIVRDATPLHYLRSRAPMFAFILVAGIAVLAVPILLTLQFAAVSNRPMTSLEDALTASLYPANFVTLASANAFGTHYLSWLYWGPNWKTLPDVSSTDDSFNYMFVGAVPVLLVLWLGLAGGRLAERGTRTVAVILALSVAFALGRYTPLFPLAYEYVPGISYFRRPVDAVFLIGLSLALLSGHLLAGYCANGLPRLRPAAAAIAITVLVALVSDVVAFSGRSGFALTSALEMARALPVMLVTAVALSLPRTPGARATAAMGVSLLAVVELVWWNSASRLNAEPRSVYQVLDDAERPENRRLITALLQLHSERRRVGDRPRIEILGLPGAWQNLAMRYGFEATNGYNPLRIGLYDKLVSPGETAHLVEKRAFPVSFEGYDCPLARALGVELLLFDRPLERIVNLKRRPDVEAIIAGPSYWLYRLKGAMPRVRFSTNVEVIGSAPGPGSHAQAQQPNSDRVMVDTETPLRRVYRTAERGLGRGRATIISWRTDRIEIEVNSDLPGVLVLYDTYYPGWVVDVDGHRLPMLRADLMFRGVELPAGWHRVTFRYDPLSLENLTAALRDAILGYQIDHPSSATITKARSRPEPPL